LEHHGYHSRHYCRHHGTRKTIHDVLKKSMEPVSKPYGFSTGSWKKRSKARFFLQI
jgi:hypothetical protein